MADCAVEPEGIVTVRAHFEHAAAGNSSQHSSPPNLMDGTPIECNTDSMSLRTRGKVVTRNSGEGPWDPESVASRHSGEEQSSRTGSECRDPQEIKCERMNLAVTNSDEHAASSATVHLEDLSVLDSGEMFTIAETEDEDPSFLDPGEMLAVSDTENEDLSVLDPREKFNTPAADTIQSQKMCNCDIFDTTGDAPWTPRKFQDDENHHITVNVIRTFPFVTDEPTVPRVFDPKLIRTSFDNLCKASCPIRASFDNPCNQTSHSHL